MTDLPLVTICIPSFNQTSFISETLESCLQQTYPNIELIVVDDCSQDGTFEIVKKFAMAHPAIRVIQNTTNLGVEKTWNLAIKNAQGELIKLLCGDDVLDHTCIEKQVRPFINNPDLSLVGCNRKIIDDKSHVIFSPNRKKFLQPTSFELGLGALIRSGTNVIGEPACVLFRKTSALFDGTLTYMIDLDFWLKTWESGPLLMLEESLAYFRIHPSSLTSSMGLKHFREYRKFVTAITNRYENQLKPLDCKIGVCKAFLISLLRNLFLSLRQRILIR